MIKIYISFILPSQHIAYNKVELSEDYSGACWRELSSLSDSRATVCRSACWGSVTLYLAPYLPDVSLSTSSAGTATCSGENCRNWERFILVLTKPQPHWWSLFRHFTLFVSTSWSSKLCNWLVLFSDSGWCAFWSLTFSIVATKTLCQRQSVCEEGEHWFYPLNPVQTRETHTLSWESFPVDTLRLIQAQNTYINIFMLHTFILVHCVQMISVHSAAAAATLGLSLLHYRWASCEQLVCFLN